MDAAAENLAAFQAAFPAALIAYAVKANTDPRLLRRLAAAGAGAEVVNAVELALAQQAGFPSDRIVMNGVGKTDADLAAADEVGALVNAESLEEFDTLLAFAVARIGLRLNPALSADTHPHLATGAANSKFGIALTDFDPALDRCRAAGRHLESVGAHIGSAIDDLEPFTRLAELLVEAAARAEAPRINLGGGAGLGVSVDAFADAVRATIPDSSRLILEPGRRLVAEAGWLLTRVVRVQPRPEAGLTYLVADAGMAKPSAPFSTARTTRSRSSSPARSSTRAMAPSTWPARSARPATSWLTISVGGYRRLISGLPAPVRSSPSVRPAPTAPRWHRSTTVDPVRLNLSLTTGSWSSPVAARPSTT